MRRSPLLFLALLATACGSGSEPDGGPVVASDEYRFYAQAIDVGADVSVGTIRLFLDEGDERATVEQVRLMRVAGALELLGVHTRRLPVISGPNFLADPGFPPKGFADTLPLAEAAEIPVPTGDDDPPTEGLMLVIGLRTTEPGVAVAGAVEVAYRVGDRAHTLTVEQPIYLCAPFDGFPDGCPPEDAEGRFGDGVLG